MSDARGFRGYVASRPILGNRTPQHIQNLVIRDYAQRRGLEYLLSATEYAMPGSFMMLQSLLDEVEALSGIIAYSIFMLPPARTARTEVYRRIIGAGRSLHAAVEDVAIRTESDVRRVEEWFLVQQAIPVAWSGRKI
jgi:sporadic carbohydrate cluster protein (TIGR04323 family)